MTRSILLGMCNLLLILNAYGQPNTQKSDTLRIELGKYKMLIVEDADGSATVTMQSEKPDGSIKRNVFKTGKDPKGKQIIIVDGEEGTKTIHVEDKIEEIQDKLDDRLEEIEEKIEEEIEREFDVDEESEKELKEFHVENHNENLKKKRKKLSIKKRKKKYKLYSNWGGLSVGYETFYDGDRQLTDGEFFNTDRSYSIRWEFYRLSMHLGTPYTSLTSGLSWGWTFLPLKDNASLESDENMSWISTDPSKSYTKNRLSYSYLELPVFLELFTSTKRKNNIRFSAGIINKLRLTSKSTYAYTTGGKDISMEVRDDFNLFKYTPELSARLGYRGISLFANAAMSPLFKEGKGSEAQTFTMGLNFNFPVFKSGRAYRG